VIGSAVGSSGLLFRLALFLVTHTRGGFPSQVLSLGAAGLLLGPASPNATGRVAMIAPAVTELVDSLGHAPRSRAAAGLAMATLSGFGQMTGAFLTSSTTAVLVFAVLPASARAGIDWLDWAVYGLVFNLVIFTGLMAAIIRMFNPSRDDTQVVRRAHSVLALQRALLGPPSHDERWAASVTCLMLLGFVTQPLHGLHPAWIAVVALILLGAARVVTDETIRKINWSFALMFGILASMAAVFHATGLDQWITDTASSALTGMSGHSLLFLLAFTLVCVATNLVLRWQAAAPLLTIALAPIAIAANINPVIIGIIAVVVCNGFVLPYQSTVYLSLYHGTDGTLFTHAQARPLAFVFTALSFIAVIASIPYWYALGLMR